MAEEGHGKKCDDPGGYNCRRNEYIPSPTVIHLCIEYIMPRYITHTNVFALRLSSRELPPFRPIFGSAYEDYLSKTLAERTGIPLRGLEPRARQAGGTNMRALQLTDNKQQHNNNNNTTNREDKGANSTARRLLAD
ncbi:unnamed protein product [Nezara viridula]|uniref:Uncharacterized protein n=1 Tax=Nezara viridula TaxID=85310 RepID=A0A9P0H8F4_NEZVI|nr:unnamed protein product [Nezara viridula]